MTAYADEVRDAWVVDDAEAERLLEDAPWRRVVILGDSIAEGAIRDDTPGYRSLAWHERLERALRAHRPDLRFVNLGVRDLRAAEIRATQLAPALTLDPDLALVVAGGNDLLAERWDADAVERELDALVGTLRGHGAEVVTYTLMDITLAWPDLRDTPLAPRLAELNDLVRAVSRRHGALLVDQIGDYAADRTVYCADMRHGSARGQAIAASSTIRRLGRRLGRD